MTDSHTYACCGLLGEETTQYYAAGVTLVPKTFHCIQILILILNLILNLICLMIKTCPEINVLTKLTSICDLCMFAVATPLFHFPSPAQIHQLIPERLVHKCVNNRVRNIVNEVDIIHFKNWCDYMQSH